MYGPSIGSAISRNFLVRSAFFAASWYFVRACASLAPAEEEKK